MAEVQGFLTVYTPSFNGGEPEASCLSVIPPAGALAAVSEGFCPNCVVPLGCDARNWCRICEVFWSIWHGPAT